MCKPCWILIILFWNKYFILLGFASIEIVVPPAGNCGDDTVLTCVVADELNKYTGWFGLGRDLMLNGQGVRLTDSIKYAEVRNESSFSLTIRNTGVQDKGQYKCQVGFSESAFQTLNVECKAKYVTLTVTRNRNLMLVLTSVYPRPKVMLNIFGKNGSETVIHGSFTNKCPSSEDWLFNCEWTSSDTVPDGNYSYSAAVTTITTSIFTGFFKISVPKTMRLIPSTKSYQKEEFSEMNNVTCTANCAPDCQYFWIDGHGSNISTSNILTLGKLDRSLQGEYVCNAWNWFGNNNDTIFVNVMYGPESILFTPSGTTYIKNEDEVMEDIMCSVACNPNCTLEWFKAEGIDQEAVRNDGYLRFGSVKRQQAGEYKCVATNANIPGYPSIQKTLDLKVRYGPDTVKLSGGSDITLIVGEISEDIACSSECFPSCFFIWTNDNGTIMSNDSILSLGKVELTVHGEFICTVTNKATGKTIYTTLTVSAQNAVQTQEKEGTSTAAIIGGVVGMVIVLGLIAIAAFVCYKRKHNEALKPKDNANTSSQCDVSMQNKEPTDNAYEELKEREKSKKDVYEELTVSVTDVSFGYENAPVH